jgi:hypothetical protein
VPANAVSAVCDADHDIDEQLLEHDAPTSCKRFFMTDNERKCAAQTVIIFFGRQLPPMQWSWTQVKNWKSSITPYCAFMVCTGTALFALRCFQLRKLVGAA